jgi:hypothetical protein
MKIAIVKFSDIAKHPTMRMDAEYHIGKKEGKKAFKKVDKGELVEDDVNGKVMLSDAEATEYNSVQKESNKATEKLSDLKKKLKL